MSRLLTFVRSPSRRRAARGAGEDGTAERLDEIIADRRFRAFPDWLEQRYQQDTGDDQVRALFRAALAAALVYAVELAADGSLTPDVFPLAAALHFGVVTPALLAIAAFARSAVTPLRRDLLGLAIPFVVAAQVAVVYRASASAGAPYYLNLLAVVAILANASLPLSSRASLWSTALCMALLAIMARAPQGAATPVYLGGLAPISASAQAATRFRHSSPA